MREYSVALCTYNGAEYIGEQLESIINQTVTPSQIVISDDGSNDDTISIAEKILSLSNIDYLIVHNKGKHGVTPNFQNAFSYCTKSIIFCSDQDDVWVENKAEKMLLTYDQNPQAKVVFSNGELVDRNLNYLGCNVWTSVGITGKRIKEGDWFHYLIKNCLITGAAMSFKKELLEDVDEIPCEWLHDGWLAWAAVSRGGLVPCNDTLFLYRQHGNNEVGMRPSSDIGGQIWGYLRNFKKIKQLRRIRYNRYLSLSRVYLNKFSLVQQIEIKECINFWYDMIESEQLNIVGAFKCYFLHFLKGNYTKYYTGLSGFIRDLCIRICNPYQK